MDRFDAERAELERIDYFLDQLARAVERGEVHRASYENLAPRYLARRSDLVAYIQGRAEKPEADWSPAPAMKPPAVSARPATGAEVPAYAPGRPAPATVRPAEDELFTPAWTPKPAREPKPVPWTTILTFLGAFLVVVAVAIFAVFTWDLMPVPVKVGGMLALTAGFFAVAELVRLKLNLRVGGIALAVVSAAMLLFDCWVVIDGYNLTGPWPWAVSLLVCSLAYWAMELRIGSGIFAAVGAAAQVGWWWLLGMALGLSTPERMAGVALVGMVWAYVGAHFREGPARELTRVLAWAGPIAVTVAAAVAFADAVIVGAPTFTQTLSCAVIGAAGIVAVDMFGKLPRGLSALLQLPLFASMLIGLTGSTVPGWLVFFPVVAAAGYAVYELYRGTWAFAALAMLGELLFWVTLGLHFEWDGWVIGAVVATDATLWLTMGRLATRFAEDKQPGVRTLTALSRYASWVVLFISGFAAYASLGEAPPLATQATTWEHVVLVAWITTLWFAAGAIGRNGLGAAGGIFGSFWLLAAAMAWQMPDLDSAWYALALLVLAAAWLQSARWVSKPLMLDEAALAFGMRVVSLLVLAGGLLAQAVFLSLESWPPVALAAASAIAWAADAVTRRSPLAWAGAAGSAVVASALAAYAATGDAEAAPMAAAATAATVAVACGAVALLRARTTAVSAAAFAAAVAGVPVLVFADSRAAVLSLGLLALAWAGAAVAWTPAFAGVAGAALTGAALALLQYTDASAWSTVGTCAILGFVQLAPSFLKRERLTDREALATLSLAVSGLATMLVPLVIGSVASVPGLDVSAWTQVFEVQFSVALVLLGLWLVTGALARRFEAAWYAGFGAIVVGVLYWLASEQVDQPEIYTTIVGAYVIAMGYLYVALGSDRKVPRLTDVVGTMIVLAPPALQSAAFIGAQLNESSSASAAGHALWALSLSLVFILGGVVLRVRAYFFGGVAALTLVALFYSFFFLLAFWWVVLGLIGVSMLVIALTWERQRMMLADGRRFLHDRFAVWR